MFSSWVSLAVMKKHEHSGCTKKTFENPEEILLLAGVVKGNCFLDVGAGSGYLSIAASVIVGASGMVYALDSHKASVETIEQEVSDKNISNIKTMHADAVKNIPLDRDIVDVCLMSNMMHGFAANEESDKVLKNINAVMKENSKLIIIDFNKADASYGPPISIRLTPEDVENIVSPYGYVLQKQFNIGLNHYAAVFNKVSLQDKHC